MVRFIPGVFPSYTERILPPEKINEKKKNNNNKKPSHILGSTSKTVIMARMSARVCIELHQHQY